MRTLVIDIETVGEAWRELDDVTRESLTSWIARTGRNAAEKIALVEEVETGLAFSPLTGRIVSIGLFDLERAQGAVYYVGLGSEKDEEIGPYIFKQRTEVAMLREFWEGALEYDTFVTFNGRSFDLPFILHRSVANQVRPTRELMKYRYLSHQTAPYHIDLQDELTWYGAMRKRPSLHLFCRAYGIKSPKVAGISGADIAELYNQKKFRDIALYNAADVVATTALYEVWLKNLAPTSFLNTTDLDY